MTDFAQNNSLNDANGAPAGFTGNSDKSTGEYRFKNGGSQPVYSDAKFYPASEGTAPPKYYTPYRKPESGTEPKNKQNPVPPAEKPKKNRSATKSVGIAFLFLLFSVIGGVTGSYITELRLSGKLDDLSSKIESFIDSADRGAIRSGFAFNSRDIKGETDLSEVASSETDSASEYSVNVSAESPETQVVAEVLPASGDVTDTVDVPEEMSASDIYDTACSQVVGITTEVTYSNFFGQTSSSAVSGSGFILSEDGKVLTNYHVIEYAYKYGYTISVILHDGSSYDAGIVGVDADNDLAVLSIRAANLVPVEIGDSDSIRVGEAAYAVGNPLGELEFTMTSGTVSGLDRLIASDSTGAAINMFQIDATVNSGNSGGPVYNSKGQVIGVVTAKYKSTGVEGIGFAIPVNDAKRIAGDIIQNGYVTGKAYLGVYYDESSSSVYNHYYHDLWGSPAGVMVLQVGRDSCAEKAGIKSYDTITSIGEYTVENGSDLVNALRKFSAGDTVVIVIYRAGEGYSSGQTLEFSVTLDEATPGKITYNNMSEA